MNPSRPFILRPVATTLMMIAIMLSGMLAFRFLPVAALPEVDYPTIQVQTFYPGASPEVMTSSVTAPLERQFGQLGGAQLGVLRVLGVVGVGQVAVEVGEVGDGELHLVGRGLSGGDCAEGDDGRGSHGNGSGGHATGQSRAKAARIKQSETPGRATSS